jgi:hypothetical protein
MSIAADGVRCWDVQSGASVDFLDPYQHSRGQVSALSWIRRPDGSENDVLCYSTGLGYLVTCRSSVKEVKAIESP